MQDLIVVEMEKNKKMIGSGIGAEKVRSSWQERRDSKLLPMKTEAQKENPLSDKVQELVNIPITLEIYERDGMRKVQLQQ